MNGFESPNVMTNPEETDTLSVPQVSTMSIDEIQRCVARGRQMRSAHFAGWGRRLAQTWASVFRGTGRMVPPTVDTGRFAR